MIILIIAALVSGFVFGFDDKQSSFIFTNWFLNFLRLSFFSFIALGVYYLTQNYAADKYGCNLNYNIWRIQRFGYGKSAYVRPIKFGPYVLKTIPLGFIVPLLISFLSSGGLFFTGILSSSFIVNPAYRLGRVWAKLTEFEEAKIAVSGALANILLAILIKGFRLSSLEDLILISSITAISYMLPFPGLDGIKVYFGSKLLWIFSFSFILLSAFFLNFLNGFLVLVLALIAALTILATYFYKKNS
ncbi:MAG: hypothetical protein AABW58_00420 [Nanoarchaeota archaeon]